MNLLTGHRIYIKSGQMSEIKGKKPPSPPRDIPDEEMKRLKEQASVKPDVEKEYEIGLPQEFAEAPSFKPLDVDSITKTFGEIPPVYRNPVSPYSPAYKE